jgi:hypothetical protein
MNQKILIVIIIAVGFGIAGERESHAQSTNVQAILDLGVTEGRAVTNGFVLIDGKYLNIPYNVSRRGNGIFINDALIEEPSPWPIPADKIIPSEMPSMPATISQTTSPYDEELKSYLAQMDDYCFTHFSRTQALNLLESTYSNLPCVISVARERNPNYLTVAWKNGQSDSIGLSMTLDARKPVKWTRETLLVRLENDRAMYENRLEKGDYYILGTATSRTTGTIEGARTLLPQLIKIIQSSQDAIEVNERFQQASYANWGQAAAQAFFTNRASLVPLVLRVKALKGK